MPLQLILSPAVRIIKTPPSHRGIISDKTVESDSEGVPAGHKGLGGNRDADGVGVGRRRSSGRAPGRLGAFRHA
jgi:hypothetical protein